MKTWIKSSWAVSGTVLSQAERCPGQYRVKLSGVRDSTESSWAGSGTVPSQAERWPGQYWVKLSGVRYSTESRWAVLSHLNSSVLNQLKCVWHSLYIFDNKDLLYLYRYKVTRYFGQHSWYISILYGFLVQMTIWFGLLNAVPDNAESFCGPPRTTFYKRNVIQPVFHYTRIYVPTVQYNIVMIKRKKKKAKQCPGQRWVT